MESSYGATGKIDISGSTVKIDNDLQLNNLYELAHRAIFNDNSALAETYYNQIVVMDPNNWEAFFYSTYFQAMNSPNIKIAADLMINSEYTIFTLVKNAISDASMYESIINEIATQLVKLGNKLFASYRKQFSYLSIDNPQEFIDTESTCRDILYDAGDWIIELFGEDFGQIAALCWEVGVRQQVIVINTAGNTRASKKLIRYYNKKIKAYNPSYVALRPHWYRMFF